MPTLKCFNAQFAEKNTWITLFYRRLQLTIPEAGESDSGQYTCEATKDTVTASASFDVEVHIPAGDLVLDRILRKNVEYFYPAAQSLRR